MYPESLGACAILSLAIASIKIGYSTSSLEVKTGGNARRLYQSFLMVHYSAYLSSHELIHKVFEWCRCQGFAARSLIG